MTDLLSSVQQQLLSAPDFSITLSGKNITTSIEPRLISLTLTDNRGFQADQLDIEIDDTDGKIELPSRGVKIELSLGYKGSPLVNKGTFTVDEIEHHGAPDVLTIRARSADFRESLNVKRSKSYHQMTIGDIVKDIAVRNSLASAVSAEFADINTNHIDQTNESDANLLTRLALREGAIATIKAGKILFIKPGAGTSASGKPLPVVTITRQDGDNHQFSIADREAYTGVTAHWLDTLQARKKTVKVHRKRRHRKTTNEKSEPHKPEGDYLAGSEGNVMVLRHTYAYQSNAERAAKAAWERIQRGAATLSITLARAKPELFPELPVKVSGFKRQIDAVDWLLTTVTHTISNDGYTMSLQMEVKASDVEMD